MKTRKLCIIIFSFVVLFTFQSNSYGQQTIYNNFGSGHGGWDYNYGLGWTIAGVDVSQQYGVEQAIGFEATGTGYLYDLWIAISYCNPSSLPDTVVLFIVENPDGLPPDSANIMEKWTLSKFNSWSQWNEPIHLEGDGSAYLEEGKSYWLWAIGMETTWTMWRMNENSSLTCPHTIRREGEGWLNISNETAPAFRVDVETHVGVNNIRVEYGNLLGNYPNPFSISTTISYRVDKPGGYRISVFDIYGKEVELLADEYKSTGTHLLQFTPENLENGIYIVRMLADNNFVDLKKINYQKQ